MSAEQDRADVERVLAGDAEAFTGIVDRWQGPLVNLAYRFCGRHDLAEEMAQEAFIKVFRALARWRGEGAFSTWLFSVATNCYRSIVRRKSHPTVPLEAVAEAAREAEAQLGLERRDVERIVRGAVRSLPPKMRDAVMLYYFHEMDLTRAAESLGLPKGTVKSHLFRGRKLLEKSLGPLMGAAVEENTTWTSSTASS